MDPSKMLPRSGLMDNARGDMMWHGAPNAPQPHGAVSVVTTVYPGVPTFAGSSQVYNTSGTHPSGQVVYGGGHMPPQTQYIGQAGPISKTSSTNSAYGSDSVVYGSHDMQHHQNYGNHGHAGNYAPRHAVAVNAAAQAAATAVATATATATAVALDQSQFQNYSQYGNQSYQPTYQSQMGMMAPTPQHQDTYQQNHPHMMSQRHSVPSPYGPPQGSLRATRPTPNNVSRYQGGGPGSRPMVPSDSFHQQYMNSGAPTQPMALSNVGPMNQRPAIQQHMVNSYGQPQMGIGQPNSYQRFPRAELANHPYQSPMGPAAGQNIPGYGRMNVPAAMQNNYGQMANGGLPNSQNPRGNNPAYGGANTALPNNPTPPLTPASTSAVAAVGSAEFLSGNGTLPSSQGEDTDSRLTIPVKNGTILAPFRLEHNSPVSQHMFMLDDRTHQMLCTNPNYDLQLKCFHAEDKAMLNNWPNNANIQICVNGAPVIVKSMERPLYIKSYCQKQQNTLQVAVQQCCCSHLFCLSIVSRPTIEGIVHRLMQNRSAAVDHCMEKIRSFFHSGGDSTLARGTSGTDSDIEQTSVTMSLKCPITMQRIKLPARGHECKHPQCFDLRAYLEINKDRSTWLCPICKRYAPMDSLEIDQYVLSILNNVSSFDADEVTVDSSASWKPLAKQRSPQPNDSSSAAPSVKEEDNDAPCDSAAKRFKPDPSFNPPSWGRSTSSATSAVNNFQSPVYNRSENVLSPFYQSGNSPNGGASFVPTTSSGGMNPASSNFSATAAPKYSAPMRSKSGPSPLAVPQFGNPTSVGAPNHGGDSNASSTLHNQGIYAGSNGHQQLQSSLNCDTSFAIMNFDGGQSQNHATASTKTNAAISDFPDFSFDASDLLGSGDANQAGASLFNDPEELMKYLADPSDFNVFGSSSNDQQHQQSTNKDHSSANSLNAASSSKYPSGSSSDSVPASSNYQNSSQTSSELASMDEILSLLYK